MKGFIIAAPHSGAGKTLITLGILRALRRQGLAVTSAKSGPDYIDPQFHKAASGAECVNLDAWAMPAEMLRGLAAKSAGILVVEGAMGLFDGAPDMDDPMGRGSVADLASILNLPVILVLDVARQSQTATAIVQGLSVMRDDVRIAGVVLNRVGSARHGAMISRAMEVIGIPVLGMVPRVNTLEMPSRHLGLVQAMEHPDLEQFIEAAADLVFENINLDALLSNLAGIPPAPHTTGLPPFGQRIAIAKDLAFSFMYPHMLDGWRSAGAELRFFSPLADEGPGDVDAVFLPGGYPELHAGRLAGNANFIAGMHAAKDQGAVIYGECGGYMTLGESLIDADGNRHEMLGLLPVHTSFAERKLHLGYRNLTPNTGFPWQGVLKGHEFHYASIVTEDTNGRLFQSADSMGKNRCEIGHARGRVFGSFAHVIA